jgi:hypothetical protein
MTDADCRIELYRANHGGIDRNTPVELWIDNVPRGSVLPYGTVDVATGAGSHRIEVKADDASSNGMVSEIASNETLRLTVSSRPGMAWFNSLFLGKAVRLRLRRTDPSQEQIH